MTGFNLHDLAWDVAAELGVPDAGAVAAQVLAQIPEQDRDAALQEALTAYCQRFLFLARPPRVPRAPVNRSAKVTRIRSRWPQLAELVPAAGGSKPLGECTAADLRAHARALTAQAARRRELADALADNGVSTVRELPAPVLGRFFPAQDAVA